MGPIVILRLRLRRVFLVAIALSLVVAQSACGNRVVMKKIPEELIPQKLKDQVQAIASEERPVSDIVWRAHEIKDGRLLAACTFAQEWEKGVKLDMVWIGSYDIDASGDMGAGAGFVGGFERDKAFFGMPGSGERASDDDELTYRLWCVGFCFDGRVVAIEGVSTEGRTVTTTPSGGFWHLLVENTEPGEKWAEVYGVDKNGKHLVQLVIER